MDCVTFFIVKWQLKCKMIVLKTLLPIKSILGKVLRTGHMFGSHNVIYLSKSLSRSINDVKKCDRL